MSELTAIKSGRAFSKVIHLVEEMPDSSSGYWRDKSKCGLYPGKRSNGWYAVNKEVTCPKCIKLSQLK